MKGITAALLAPAMASAMSLTNLMGVESVTKEMYAKGKVHEAIMGFKMVGRI